MIQDDLLSYVVFTSNVIGSVATSKITLGLFALYFPFIPTKSAYDASNSSIVFTLSVFSELINTIDIVSPSEEFDRASLKLS
jgi:hypothetical protein